MLKIGAAAIVSIASLCFAGGALAPAPAEAQASRCDSIQDRDRRRNCRNGERDSAFWAEESRSWRETEDDIRQQHMSACRKVGKVGRIVGIGKQARVVCDAPRWIDNMRERRR